uniref:Probable protein-export membrane protein SecG n=1 Tax=Dichotomaria marginata TaxID=268567 RepID=A0A1G4NSD1_9FLOR|nr:hypothetical protein P8460_pgp092 [Dichotomaria marginata]SCW21573.1 secG [Dichotomaria marginata]
MKWLWYTLSLILVVLILINNPKTDTLRTFSGTNKLFTNSSEASTILEILTWSSASLFLCFTIILRIYTTY